MARAKIAVLEGDAFARLIRAAALPPEAMPSLEELMPALNLDDEVRESPRPNRSDAHMTRFFCTTCKKGPRSSDGSELLFRTDDGLFWCPDHLPRTSLRFEQALRQPFEPSIAARLRADGEEAPPQAAEAAPVDDTVDIEESLGVMTVGPAPAGTSARTSEEMPVLHKFGTGQKKKIYAVWRAKDGDWRAARDVWIPGPDGKHKVRDIQLLGPFVSRRLALDVVYSLNP